MNQADLIGKVQSAHLREYGRSPTTITYAPGRLEVLGNHTDYNLGTVLAAAIDLGVVFAISASVQSGVRLKAVDAGETASFPQSIVGNGYGPGWAELIKGVMLYLKERGVQTGRVDCTFGGSLPIGAGLSSSAALAVSCAMAVLDHSGGKVGGFDLARICRDAERSFLGNNCGLLDQLSSLFAQTDALLHIDFAGPTVSNVALPAQARFLLVDTGTAHCLVESPYNERRRTCEQASERLSRALHRKVRALAEVTPAELRDFAHLLSETQARCAGHVIDEIARVAQARIALDAGDLHTFGEILYASHNSSKVRFQNSSAELDAVVEAARDAGALGARLTGGGWGGNALVLAPEDRTEPIAQSIARNCRTIGLAPHVRPVTVSRGAEVVGAPRRTDGGNP